MRSKIKFTQQRTAAHANLRTAGHHQQRGGCIVRLPRLLKGLPVVGLFPGVGGQMGVRLLPRPSEAWGGVEGHRKTYFSSARRDETTLWRILLLIKLYGCVVATTARVLFEEK